MRGATGTTSWPVGGGDAWLRPARIGRLLRDDPAIIYQLLIRVDHPTRICIGRRAPIVLPIGWYVYSGSARRGSSARLTRHLRKRKVLRWHIDHLLTAPHARVTAVRFWPWKPGLECAANQALVAAGAKAPIAGFGSSDCRGGCPAHLVALLSRAMRPDHAVRSSRRRAVGNSHCAPEG